MGPTATFIIRFIKNFLLIDKSSTGNYIELRRIDWISHSISVTNETVVNQPTRIPLVN